MARYITRQERRRNRARYERAQECASVFAIAAGLCIAYMAGNLVLIGAGAGAGSSVARFTITAGAVAATCATVAVLIMLYAKIRFKHRF